MYYGEAALKEKKVKTPTKRVKEACDSGHSIKCISAAVAVFLFRFRFSSPSLFPGWAERSVSFWFLSARFASVGVPLFSFSSFFALLKGCPGMLAGGIVGEGKRGGTHAFEKKRKIRGGKKKHSFTPERTHTNPRKINSLKR
ncbi:hypothetical protein ABB37_00651 [Leptomonas pyrrhocoris]|uniref:Uncharacterized protein n=1 Tax=Leptomonas pyrrhocoris TaxID=157538 RepID=A0A0M9GAV1_LEPPY|nr:hypothetical protein ABB37_00651 [Leptomonas pyrrhocoris]KPA86503.1 hypothetical protein ABB37_00651 [Leptomonas pyrrhocoris]|eukprot:XP_015664942.1 hypothetical protein ABB37_00651 [Leptomonas pyrrhocoris]